MHMRRPPDLIAKITLLPTEEGGRRDVTPDDKLNCIMVIGSRHFDVRLHLDRTGALRPGQKAIVPISFYDPDLAKDFVEVGQKFKLRELTTIGEGLVEEVRVTAAPRR